MFRRSILLCGLFGISQAVARNVPRGDVSFSATSPFDHSWIESFSALGDSYAAGVGAGHVVSAGQGLEPNTDCYQYSYGYPILLNMEGMIGANTNRHFQYLGCSGALVPDIRDKQVPKMNRAQLVTLSAGGNDAHLATILNWCIYQWAVLPPIISPWSCDGEIQKADDAVNDLQYTENLESLLSAIETKLINDDSRIYWVAYERFWDHTTKECDYCTWSLTVNIDYQEYLTQARRIAMNSLVDNVNSKIKAVCDKLSRCVYVDQTEAINKFAGHFCEPGVDEYAPTGSGGNSANRERTWFYQWSTTKDDDTPNEGDIDQIERHSLLRPRICTPRRYNDASFEGVIAKYIAQGIKNDNFSPETMGMLSNLTMTGSTLPASLGRMFHLDKSANMVVAGNILAAMDFEQAKMMNTPLITTTIDGCAISSATPTATISCEVGNYQVNGLYCVCDAEPDQIAAFPLATTVHGWDLCAYSTVPRGTQIKTARPTTSASPTPPSSPHPVPYLPTEIPSSHQVNECCIHVLEYWPCEKDTVKFWAFVQVWDAAGNGLFGLSPPINEVIKAISAKVPDSWLAELEDFSIATYKYEGDYAQFIFEAEDWQTSDEDPSSGT